MSHMSTLVLELQEIVDPMTYMGFGDKQIIEEVRKVHPNIPESWITSAIYIARFDYNEFDSYY